MKDVKIFNLPAVVVLVNLFYLVIPTFYLLGAFFEKAGIHFVGLLPLTAITLAIVDYFKKKLGSYGEDIKLAHPQGRNFILLVRILYICLSFVIILLCFQSLIRFTSK